MDGLRTLSCGCSVLGAGKDAWSVHVVGRRRGQKITDPLAYRSERRSIGRHCFLDPAQQGREHSDDASGAEPERCGREGVLANETEHVSVRDGPAGFRKVVCEPLSAAHVGVQNPERGVEVEGDEGETALCGYEAVAQIEQCVRRIGRVASGPGVDRRASPTEAVPRLRDPPS